ncbi:MAG: NADH-quinone oxidoreductase subunit N [Planctomycetaceae bacterium]
MTFDVLLNQVINETLQVSICRFSPELIVSATIIALLLTRLFGIDRWVTPYWTTLIGSLIALGSATQQFLMLQQGELAAGEYFTGLMVFDGLTAFLRIFLLLFLILVTVLTVLSGIPDLEDGPDFYTLLLGSTLGMMIMGGANHLLMLFLGIEMTSVPSYAMVGYLKGRRQSSEAALKYVVYGAGAAGVMLYGISLIAGMLGTGDLSEIAQKISLLVGTAPGFDTPVLRTLSLAILMVFVGLAFKLSLVPFHFWCPDAFEGASAEVAGYLSVASKAAAFGLLIRFCLALMGNTGVEQSTSTYLHLGIGLGFIAMISATYGNLAAYTQTNVKRLLAYSTIAHAGYMLMAVSAMMVVLNAPAGSSLSVAQQNELATGSIQGLLYYLVVYLFMNLGAFAIVALIRNEIFSEEIASYRGLARQAPVLCVCMMICLFSLIGVPPMAGFFGKFFVFASVFQATEVHWSMWLVLIVGGINTVFSLYYYLIILKAMFLDERPIGAKSVHIPMNPCGWYVVFVTAPILVLVLCTEQLTLTARHVAAGLFHL